MPLVRCKNIYTCYNQFINNNASSDPNIINFRFYPGKVPISARSFWSYNFGELNSWRPSSIWKELNFFSLVMDRPKFDHWEQKTYGIYRWTHDNTRLILPYSIVPGMSGSPLLSYPLQDLDINNGIKRLIGLSLQNDDSFHEAIFITNIAIGDLLKQYILENKSTLLTPELFWAHDGRSLHRVMSFGIMSLAENKTLHRDTGGGDGKGDMGDPSTHLKQPSALDSDFGANLTLRDQSNSSKIDILGFKYNNHSDRALWADLPSLQYLFNAGKDFEKIRADVILDHSSLIPFLKSKLESSRISNSKILEAKEGRGLLTSFLGLFVVQDKKPPTTSGYQNPRLPKDETLCEIKINPNSENQPLNAPAISINLRLKNIENKLVEDHLDFNLNKNGYYLESEKSNKNYFMPRFILKSNGQDEFVVDIRQLFFTDLYELHSESNGGFTDVPDLLQTAEADEALIKIRNLTKNRQAQLILCTLRGE